MSYRRAIALPTWLALRVVTVTMFAAGFAALVTTALAWFLNQTFEASWVRAVPAFTLKIAVAFLPAAVISFIRMPGPARILRDLNEPEAEESWALSAAMVVLIVLVLIQVTPLITWWNENLALWRESTGGQLWDPLGFNFALAVLLLVNPFIGFLTIFCFVATSVQVVMVHTRTVRAVLIAAVFLQGGLVIGGYLVADGLISAAQALLAAGPPSPETDRFAAWIASERSAASGVTFWLVAIFGGYLVSVAVAPKPGAAEAPGPAKAGPYVQKEEAPNAVRPAAEAGPYVPAGIDRIFSESLYSVKPRGSWVHAWLGRRYPEYEIKSVPPSRESDFLFSWATGELRRAPDGPVVLRLKQQVADWSIRKSYSVIDPESGASLATLRPKAFGWEIVDPTGSTVATVERALAKARYCRFIARAGGLDACQFTCAIPGLTAFGAELEIAFPQGASQGMSRAVAIALGPLLEAHGRRITYRINA